MPESNEVENHFFLSYAHRDNEPYFGQKWVENFQLALKVRLGQLLGQEPKIWWDHATLQGNKDFVEAINQGVSRSAVLIPILSPSYINSEWCRKELDAFCEAAKRMGELPIETRDRIFKVIKTDVSDEDHPDELKNLLGYKFFRKDPATNRYAEFHWVDVSKIDQEYIQKIDDLAVNIRLVIKELKVYKPGELPVVYLAENSSDLTAERDQVLRVLRQRGYTVLPNQSLLTNGQNLRQIVQEALDHAELSIHLVGRNYATIPESETESIEVIQNSLAAARSTDPTFCRLIWIPPNVEASDARQQDFINLLQNNSDAQHGAEVLQTTLEKLETVIEDKVRTKKEIEVNPPSEEDGADLKYIYLICDRSDLEAAETLRDFLYDKDSRLDVTLSIFEGEETNILSCHKDNLVTCDAVLLFHGSAPEAWFEAKRQDLRKAAGYGRYRPLIKCFFLALPENSRKQRFRTREALVIKNFGDPSMELLKPFLAQL